MQIIVNITKSWGIGREGDQPFYIPEDLAFFKAMTLGKVVIMGRATLAALPGGRPLKGRTNIVLTRNAEFEAEGVIICHSLEELFERLADFAPEEIFVIGGAEIYAALLPHCTKAYITKIFAEADCDRFLPNLDEMPEWQLAKTSEIKNHEGIEFCFCEYERRENYGN
ncbi:MAG: dihydrofolate reductase [Clostridiales bacterium]|jgi:dihydrofolate reductase|nr:dihydrofolate reductase [Clostridiales bacterium]